MLVSAFFSWIKPADADPEALEIKLIPAPEMVVDKTLVDSRLADIVDRSARIAPLPELFHRGFQDFLPREF